MIPKESVDASFSFMLPFRVVVATHSRRSPGSENVQTCQHSSVQTSFTPNSFPCHTSEKSPANSNHCHTSKIAKNNPCSCHTSETPGGCILSNQTSDDRLRPVSLLPSRDENPVTATLLESALTNCDARKSFRMCFYVNCRVSPALCSLFSLFSPRTSHNSFPFNGIRTLSKDTRVYGLPFLLRELCALCDLCVSSDAVFGLSTFKYRLSTSRTDTSDQSRAIPFSLEASFQA